MKYTFKPKPKKRKGFLWIDKQTGKEVDPYTVDSLWKPRLGVFKYRECIFDAYSMEATSYWHWTFVKQIGQRVFFNDYGYSNTTRSHQYAVRHILDKMEVKYITVSARQGLDDNLSGCIEELFTAICILKNLINRKGSRVAIRKARRKRITQLNHKINKLRYYGAKYDKSRLESIGNYELREEKNRADRLELERIERERIRNRISEIAETDPLQLDPHMLATERNMEVTRALVRRIGIGRVLTELNAKVIDSKEEYQLVDLRFSENDSIYRPYLKMVNPSTGDIHVEGVHPNCRTVTQALIFRNTGSTWVDGQKFIKPIKLT